MSDTPPPAEGWRQGPDGKWYGPGEELPKTATDEETSGTPPAPPASSKNAVPTERDDLADAGRGSTTSKRRLFVVGGIAAAAVLVVLIAVVATGGEDGQTLTGEFTLSDTDAVTGTAESCRGTGGYSDFGPGMNVTVRKGSGEIVASGNTESLSAEEHFATEVEEDSEEGAESTSPQEIAETMFDLLGCTVVFEIEVPKEDFYAIAVGRRGELSYSRQELEELNWNVSLTIGD